MQDKTRQHCVSALLELQPCSCYSYNQEYHGWKTRRKSPGAPGRPREEGQRKRRSHSLGGWPVGASCPCWCLRLLGKQFHRVGGQGQAVRVMRSWMTGVWAPNRGLQGLLAEKALEGLGARVSGARDKAWTRSAVPTGDRGCAGRAWPWREEEQDTETLTPANRRRLVARPCFPVHHQAG